MNITRFKRKSLCLNKNTENLFSVAGMIDGIS